MIDSRIKFCVLRRKTVTSKGKSLANIISMRLNSMIIYEYQREGGQKLSSSKNVYF